MREQWLKDLIRDHELKQLKPEHTANERGYGPHPWDCPACEVEQNKARKQGRYSIGSDPRSETFWSM